MRTGMVFLSALVLCLVLTPLVRKLALHMGAVVKPSGRSVHLRPIPHLGGVAIYVSFTVAALLAGGAAAPVVRGTLLAGLFICLWGVWDDFSPMPAWRKVVGQLLAAGILVAHGLTIPWLVGPWDRYVDLGWLEIPLTVFWLVAMMNVINLVDGLDGLAAGISCIASFTLFFVARGQGVPEALLMTTALAGCTAGFLRYNFNPARIFMGDAGALFLGLALGSVSVAGAMKTATVIAVIIPLVALGIPVLDTAFAILRRLRDGRPIYEADRDHLHHRLLGMGLSQRQAVLVMYFLSLVCGVVAVSLSRVRVELGLGIAAVAALVILLGGRWFGLLHVRNGRTRH
ncbi:MAG: MraY family glycosyltransferase [Bacillota bacterium]